MNRNGLSPACPTDRLHNLRRQAEANIFRHYLYFFDAAKAVLTQIIHNVLDEDLRS